MNKFYKKNLVLLVCATLLLTFTVSGTVAYLAAGTSELVNTFTPSKVNTTIEEYKSGNVKSSIQVAHEADSNVDVYVRVALVGNWVDEDGNIVEPWNGTIDYNDTYWKTIDDDGYYYYKYRLEVGGITENLLKTSITADPVNGLHLVLKVIHQSVQADPDSAVYSAWGIDATNFALKPTTTE